jgi:hypothetical protein
MADLLETVIETHGVLREQPDGTPRMDARTTALHEHDAGLPG